VGEKDKFLSPEVMKEFQKKMTAAGTSCEIEIYPKQGHSFFDDNKGWIKNK
jgi:dienelactone hydrolase